MKIGRYQLENLVREGIRFIFADLRSQDERAAFSDALLAKAVPMSVTELRVNLDSNSVPRDAAILLLSQDGKIAETAAAGLEADGFKNVYIVRDGIESLRAN